jgi:hypothetical protein
MKSFWALCVFTIFQLIHSNAAIQVYEIDLGAPATTRWARVAADYAQYAPMVRQITRYSFGIYLLTVVRSLAVNGCPHGCKHPHGNWAQCCRICCHRSTPMNCTVVELNESM